MEKEILVYSNEEMVELFVNGVSVGKRRRDSQDFPAQGFHWNVVLQEGHNMRHLGDAAFVLPDF